MDTLSSLQFSVASLYVIVVLIAAHDPRGHLRVPYSPQPRACARTCGGWSRPLRSAVSLVAILIASHSERSADCSVGIRRTKLGKMDRRTRPPLSQSSLVRQADQNSAAYADCEHGYCSQIAGCRPRRRASIRSQAACAQLYNTSSYRAAKFRATTSKCWGQALEAVNGGRCAGKQSAEEIPRVKASV
jgi:hypothetical protein